MGGIKDMLSPPCQNMGGIYPPQDLRPCSCLIQIYKEFKNKNLTDQGIAEINYFQRQFDLQDSNIGKIDGTVITG